MIKIDYYLILSIEKPHHNSLLIKIEEYNYIINNNINNINININNNKHKK
jgi:hypothetical protein